MSLRPIYPVSTRVLLAVAGAMIGSVLIMGISTPAGVDDSSDKSAPELTAAAVRPPDVSASQPAAAPVDPSASPAGSSTPFPVQSNTVPVPPPATAVPSGQPPAVAPSVVPVTALDLYGMSADVEAPAEAFVRGKAHPQSIVYTCTLVCSDEVGQVSVITPSGARTVSGTVGILDLAPDPNEKGTFAVLVNGVEYWHQVVSLEKTVSFSVAVRAGDKVTFRASRPGTVTNPVLAGAGAAVGADLREPHLAWLQPVFG